MAFAKKVQLPLKPYYSVFKSSIHTVEGKNFSIHTMNVGSPDGAYDFEGTEFLINLITCTGFVQGSEKWLLATTSPDENNKVFSLNIQSGKDVDKEKTAEAIGQWEKTGYLIAINTKDIPVLEMLAESLYKHKVLVRGKIKINLSWDKTTRDTYSSYLDNYLGFVKENKRIPTKTDGEVYDSLAAISQLLTVPIPYMDMVGYQLQQYPGIDENGIPTGTNEYASVPFKGTFPEIEDFIFSIPSAPVAKSGTKNGTSVSSAVVEGYKSNEGWEWIQNNHDSVAAFFKERYPDIDDISIIPILLSISGVNSVPGVITKSFSSFKTVKELLKKDSGEEITQPEKTSNLFRLSDNGASEPTIEPEQAKDFVTVVAAPVESNQIIDALEKHFTRNKLKFTAWAKKHPIEDQENILYIFDSMLYVKHKDKVDSWVGDRMGSPSPIPPTALDSAQLKELKDYAEQYQSLSSVDPQLEPNLPE